MNSTYYNIIKISNGINKDSVINNSLIKNNQNSTFKTNIMEMNGLKQSEINSLDGILYMEELNLKTRNSMNISPVVSCTDKNIYQIVRKFENFSFNCRLKKFFLSITQALQIFFGVVTILSIFLVLWILRYSLTFSYLLENALVRMATIIRGFDEKEEIINQIF